MTLSGFDLDRVWDTVKDDLPPLVNELGTRVATGENGA